MIGRVIDEAKLIAAGLILALAVAGIYVMAVN